MSVQDMKLQPGTDVSPTPHRRVDAPETPVKTPSEVEKTAKAEPEIHVYPAIGDPTPVRPIDAGIDNDDLFPEGGRGWLVILGCFMLSAMTLGFGCVELMVAEYYRHNILVGTSDSVLGLLGSTQGAVGTLSSLFIGKLGDRYGYKGVLQGLATGLCFPFVLAYPSQWFKRRRGLATGIVAAGSSFGGGTATLILRAMLTHISFRNTLLIYAGIHCVFMSIAICLVKEGPAGAATRAIRGRAGWADKEVLKDPVFWSTALSMGLCIFGFFSPYFFMPTYAASRIPTLSAQYTVLPSSIMNFSSALGRSLVGLVADSIGPANAFICAITISALSQLLIWNFAYNYVTIMVFSVAFGATGGCFLSLMTPLAAQLFGTRNLAGLTGTFNFFMTPGNLAAAPIAGLILSASGGNWHAPISYSGGVQLAAISLMLYSRLRRQPALFAKF
ncbi:glycoside hydrolase family 61 protein [Rhizoctonia solani]|uniref:Glycoside hydrolase family 61 protein n=1 Tax=Rhizoctonia solani TaxID=456999 RepID=A0A8H8P190_9AGAM|nr:glycoside hydrolase family 61 protein [Rhizoctonia solani]QRW21842.1 glycoside hydrolase family 61 protein [Rhizoctonia solani]